MSRKAAPDRDPHFQAYRAAKAAHKAAVAALKQAKIADRALIERRSAAATAEFMALSALLRKPRTPLAVEASLSRELVGMEPAED